MADIFLRLPTRRSPPGRLQFCVVWQGESGVHFEKWFAFYDQAERFALDTETDLLLQAVEAYQSALRQGNASWPLASSDSEELSASC